MFLLAVNGSNEYYFLCPVFDCRDYEKLSIEELKLFLAARNLA